MKLLDSANLNKDSALVTQTFASVKATLDNIQVFHTDCGNEFKNKIINKMLKASYINCSLSMEGRPYDNNVVKAIFKVVKTEFVYTEEFDTSEELQYIS